MTDQSNNPTAEHARLAESRRADGPWRLWGPYLAGRQWGTVREDYSANGDAWSSFPFDQANARAYRWGEDGLGGICDRHGFINFGLALWNGKDPILKERLFGLTNGEGNHGEDVKEYWWAVDGTPSHSWMQWLYRYPHDEFPYEKLRAENRHRGRDEREYELADTQIFDDDRFFDVMVTYAKAGPDDLCITIAKRELIAEPFLLVGIIASIKEIVVLSVKAADEIGKGSSFADAMWEVGVLGVLVLLLGFTAWLLRLKEREPGEGGDGEPFEKDPAQQPAGDRRG